MRFKAFISSRLSTVITTILIGMMAVSCIYEHLPQTEESGGSVALYLVLNADGPATRAFNDPENGEGTVKKLRIIIFDWRYGQWIWEKQVLIDDFSSSADPVKVEVEPGRKRVYLIANDNVSTYALYQGGSFSSFVFSNSQLTSRMLEQVVVEKFSYIDPDTGKGPDFSGPWTEQDLLPMVCVKELEITREQALNNVPVLATFALQRCICEADVNISLKEGADMTGKTIAVEYVSIDDNPSHQYLIENKDEQSRTLLPSGDKRFSVKYVPSAPVDIVTGTLSHNFYLTENPYGTYANVREVGSDFSNHLEAEGYSGITTKLTICYDYSESNSTSRKTITRDLPYIIRNGRLIVNAVIVPPQDSHSFDIDVKVDTRWTDRLENVPVFE